jgi:excinuclease ABC subunit C
MTFEELKEKARTLPLLPGVYLMADKDGTIIYVGKAKALRNRVSQYFQDSAGHTQKTRAMVSQISSFDVIVAESEFEALVLECALIKRHKPRYNILLKDGKGYPYIRLSVKEAYPQFSLAGKAADDGAKYFGPFGGRKSSQDIIDALCTALKIPTCNRKFPRDIGKERPCLNYHMGQCDGYCRSEMTTKQHKEAIRQAVRLLEGKFSEVEKELTEAMTQAAEQLEFEKAAMLRDRLHAIERLGKRQNVVTGRLSDTDVIGIYQGEVRCAISVLHYQQGELTDKDTELLQIQQETKNDILEAFLKQYYIGRRVAPGQILIPIELSEEASLSRMLSEEAGRRVQLVTPHRGAKVELIRLAEGNAQEACERVTTKEEKTARLLILLGDLLELEAPPKRIEAFDISNTGAADIVGAMTVFLNGRPHKGQYRYFKVKELAGPDDYAAMEQVLRRRFRHEVEQDKTFASKPDLLLIDGGKEHAAIGATAVKQAGLDIPVFGMVKDQRHRTRALMTPDGREIGLQGTPALFALIGQIQEETHRSAVGFHQKQRSKSSYGSALERIPGVGESRRKKLLKTFKSIKGIREAQLWQLEDVVPKDVAQTVHDYFRTKES